MNIPSKLAAALVLATSTVGVLSTAAPAEARPAERAACYTSDGVYKSNQGVTTSGTLYWSNSRSGSYSVRLSNTRDGRSGAMFVQFLKHGIGWVDTYQTNVADGSAITVSNVFSKSYQVDAVSFGVAAVGSRMYEVLWDRNSACGA